MLSRLIQLFSKPCEVEPCQPQLELDEDSSPPANPNSPWIGVDLDGTLAKDDLWVSENHIGKPVGPMMRRVKGWIAQGITVKIVTARAGAPNGIPPVKAWLKKQGLPDLDVTNEKDFNMIELWDDRAIQVIPNTGEPVINGSMGSLPKAPMESKDQS